MEVEFGIVKFWNPKGWGFLSRDDGKNDMFVHLSCLSEGLNSLAPQQLVQFKIGKGPKGTPQATEVFVVKEPDDVEEQD